MRRAIQAIGASVVLAGCLPMSYGTAVDYAPQAQPDFALVMPATAPPIAQQFRPPPRDGEAGHMGLDVATDTGTEVIAAAPGVVTISTYEPAYGNRIVIEHAADPGGRRVQTLYFHLETRGVEVGDRVRRGQQIGTLGATGALSSYPHLHFEYHREQAPGARTASGDNWWQGMVQEDPNLHWVAGAGRVTCFAGQRAPAHLITYPVVCNGPR